MIRTVVIALLVVSVAVFIWYFVTNQESFSPCINCHLETQKNRNETSENRIPENETFENEIPEEKKTLLDFDDFREDYKPPGKELDSILKVQKNKKVLFHHNILLDNEMDMFLKMVNTVMDIILIDMFNLICKF